MVFENGTAASGKTRLDGSPPNRWVCTVAVGASLVVAEVAVHAVVIVATLAT